MGSHVPPCKLSNGWPFSGLPFSGALHRPNIKGLHATPAFSDQTAELALAIVALSTPCQSIQFLPKYMHLSMCNVWVHCPSDPAVVLIHSVLSVKYQAALYL